jgi:hypothetical protein
MYEFIFLGLIPGTHIQVTFSTWLFAAGTLAITIAIYRTWYGHSRMVKWPAVRHKFYAVGRRQAVRG